MEYNKSPSAQNEVRLRKALMNLIQEIGYKDGAQGVRDLKDNARNRDNAVYDLYGGLVNGATLVPVETAAQANPARWVRTLREGRASMIFAVPTLFQTLSQLNLLKPHLLPSVRIFMFGGEGT